MFGLISTLLFITCLLGGFLVSYNFLAEKLPKLEEIRKIVEGVKSYVGLACVIIGIWSLIQQHIYDFIPAILSIACGLILSSTVFKYINLSQDPEKSELRKSFIQSKLDSFSVFIGFAALIFGLVHFIDIILHKGTIWLL